MKTTQTEAPNEKLLDDFESVVIEAQSLIKSIADASSDKVGGMRASVEQGLAAAGDRLAKIREQAVDQASSAARATDDFVQQNPWRAIGIGALAGLVAGLIIARR